MANNTSPALQLPSEYHEEQDDKEALTTGLHAVLSSSANSSGPIDEGSRVNPDPVFHTAFMQCRSCCNCDPQCSYYGKGHFNALGNYIGS